jgi:hypothetical protein
VPLFEIRDPDVLIPFRTLHGGAELYEREIEDLLWTNLDDLLGESLFAVARQPALPEGGRPDIVCLDGQGRVVVVEVKRDVARVQLAQCLEYAGWARSTNLQEIAEMYHQGHDAFFAAWQDFTESEAPPPIGRSVRLVLVARDFHGRTGSALDFLVEHGLPVLLIRVALYEDEAGRRFLDVEGEHEPEIANPGTETTVDVTRIEGRRLRLSDLLDSGLLRPGDELIWNRPRVGQEFTATVTGDGRIQLVDGRTFSSPSRAAMEAAEIASYDGWYAWRTRSTAETLHSLRERLSRSGPADQPPPG